MISFPQRTKPTLPGSLLDMADEALPEGSPSCHLQAQIIMSPNNVRFKDGRVWVTSEVPHGLSLYFQHQRPVSYLTESENWSQGSEC